MNALSERQVARLMLRLVSSDRFEWFANEPRDGNQTEPEPNQNSVAPQMLR